MQKAISEVYSRSQLAQVNNEGGAHEGMSTSNMNTEEAGLATDSVGA